MKKKPQHTSRTNTIRSVRSYRGRGDERYSSAGARHRVTRTRAIL